MTLTVDSMLRSLQPVVPGLRVRYKSESGLMHLLAAILAFNPKFLTGFTTTLGSTVYFPSREWVQNNSEFAASVLAHEAVHAYDYQQSPWRFVLGYLFPQVLAVPALLALAVLAFLAHPLGHYFVPAFFVLFGAGVALGLTRKTGLSTVALYAALGFLPSVTLGLVPHGWVAVLIFLATLAPWPAPFRTRSELRGYTMSLAIVQWTSGAVAPSYLDLLAGEFTGPHYYWMSWSSVRAELMAAVKAARSGALYYEFGPYGVVDGLIRAESPRD